MVAWRLTGTPEREDIIPVPARQSICSGQGAVNHGPAAAEAREAPADS